MTSHDIMASLLETRWFHGIPSLISRNDSHEPLGILGIPKNVQGLDEETHRSPRSYALDRDHPLRFLARKSSICTPELPVKQDLCIYLIYFALD